MTNAPATQTSNFGALLWHAVFLALASNFMDVDTVIPAMLIKAGGSEIHLGFLTAIMVGGARFSQLLFAGFLSHRPRKKTFLLWASTCGSSLSSPWPWCSSARTGSPAGS